jgi:hypothetical protein
VLSPILFNVYLEEAIRSSQKLEEVRSRGDLLAFADDMLVMSNSQHEIEMIINEFTTLNDKWNLRLNKKKSEILTNAELEEINGVRCSKIVKYLGVKVTVDKKEQIKVAREQVNKNVQLLRWKLKKADSDVLERLTCCLARSLLIYIGTPMAAVGLWKRKDIDQCEASIYRKILGVPNNITNRAILNTMTSMRLAGEAITRLSRSTWEQYKKQNRVTQYYEKKSGAKNEHKNTA